MKQMKKRTFNCLVSFLIIFGIGGYFFYLDNYRKSINLNENNIKISLSNTDFTNKNIELSVDYNGDYRHIKEYSFDEGKTWGYNNILVLEKNNKVNIWVKDINDKIYKTNYDVKNIDKEGPVILLDDNIKVSRFSNININDYVTVYDSGVGLREEVLYTPEYLNTNILGEQKIYVYAIDKLANKTIKQINFEVVPKAEYTLARNIELNKSNVILKQGEKFTFNVTFTPKYSVNKVIRWNSSDINVVKVDNQGNIVGLTPGTATVSATTTNGIISRAIVIVK